MYVKSVVRVRVWSHQLSAVENSRGGLVCSIASYSTFCISVYTSILSSTSTLLTGTCCLNRSGTVCVGYGDVSNICS